MTPKQMKPTRVVFYRQESGRVPLQQWLDKLPERHRRRCQLIVRQLQQLGRRLHAPYTHPLRDGISELRTRAGTVRYRILFFWHGSTAVISHGFAKKTSAVPHRELEKVLNRKRQFAQNPTMHSQEIENV